MFVLKVALLVFVLAFSITDVYCLTCWCADDVCIGNVTDCTAGEVCFAAEIRLQDKTIKLKKGCKPKSECDNVGHCPDGEPGSECAKYGCCNYDRCVVNYTLGKDFETPSPAPTPTIGLAATSTMKAPMVSSSDVLEATSSVVPMATKETRAPSPAATASSSLAAKMTSEPVMLPTESKMSSTGPPQPMTSTARPEVMPTGSMAKMAKSSPVKMAKSSPVKMAKSSLVKEMKPTTSLTSAGVLSSNVLKEKGKDNRPPCDASGRMLSLGTFVLTAIGLLCILM